MWKIRTNVNNIISNLLVSPNTNYTMFLLGHNNFELLTGGPLCYHVCAQRMHACMKCLCVCGESLLFICTYLRLVAKSYHSLPRLSVVWPLWNRTQFSIAAALFVFGPLDYISRFMLFRSDQAIWLVQWYHIMLHCCVQQTLVSIKHKLCNCNTPLGLCMCGQWTTFVGLIGKMVKKKVERKNDKDFCSTDIWSRAEGLGIHTNSNISRVSCWIRGIFMQLVRIGFIYHKAFYWIPHI